VALYGSAAVLLGAVWPGGPTLGVVAALLVGLGGVVVAVYLLARRSESAVAAAESRAGEAARGAELLHATVEGAAVGLGLVDASGRWLQANGTLLSIVGRSAGELKGTGLQAITAPDASETVARALADVSSGAIATWTGESRQVRPDGEQILVTLEISTVAVNGAGPVLLIEETDVSVDKRAEQLRDALAAVRHTIATSGTWDLAAPPVLAALGSTLGWDVAQFWTLDADSVAFHLRHGWHRETDRLAAYELECRRISVPAGEGVFGRARQSGVPAIEHSVMPQAHPALVVPARRAGLNDVTAVPVAASADVRTVLVLLSEHATDRGEDVMTMLATAGSEIGGFMERAEVHEALRRSEADHRGIFERSPMGIARISAEGGLLEANPALIALLGHDLATIRDHAWPELLRSYDQAAARARVAPLLAGISAGGSVQVRAVTAGGQWLWMQMTATSIPDATGRPEHVLVMVEDVTRVRDAQDSAAEALDAQKAAIADLEKLDRTKTEFLSIVSHEFRTALTGIQGFSELIRDGGLEPDELRAYGGYIFNDAERVNRLIGDMLDLDRMESGRMIFRMADVDVNEVLSEAIARATASSNVEFKPDLDPRLPIVTGDRDRLVQVVSNLVNNAVKYSPDGGTVTLASRSEGGFALVTVADTGLGIPPDEIGHVFERFRRVRSGAAQSIAGTGLGLTIVKQIVEMHGGKIWVESAVGHGSAFHFTIPLAVENLTPSMQLRHA
jgi:PAS domain S-box-containing protein